MIDTSSKWWVGTVADDLEGYLRAFAANQYPIQAFRLAACTCGSTVFLLWSDADEGCAKRVCWECGKEHFICDSSEFWSDAQPKLWTCLCSSQKANIGAGFSLYDDGEVRWLYLGERCTACGVMGSAVDWKVGYAPSSQLLDQV